MKANNYREFKLPSIEFCAEKNRGGGNSKGNADKMLSK